MTTLAAKKCAPCSSGVPPLSDSEKADLLNKCPGWDIVANHHLRREFRFPDFVSALKWVNKVGALAESEGHHPDMLLSWGRVVIEIWTHKIDNLSTSDFILAAKINEIALPG